jgi:hypothetical protein
MNEQDLKQKLEDYLRYIEVEPPTRLKISLLLNRYTKNYNYKHYYTLRGFIKGCCHCDKFDHGAKNFILEIIADIKR